MLLLVVSACAPVDTDGDGTPDADDCRDADPAVFPGAGETCGNGVDDDCDLSPGDCGLFGDQVLEEADATWIVTGLGAVGGGFVPVATVPGLGVLRLVEGTWIPSASEGFGAALASSEAGLLIGDPVAGEVTVVGEETRVISGAGDAVAYVGTRIAVGDADSTGAVYLLDADDTSLDAADTVLVGDSTDARAGSAVLGGDLDGDGVDDVVVGGLPGNVGSAIAWLVLGPVEGTISLADADARLPVDDVYPGTVALDGPCDLDGGGIPFVIVSAPGTEEDVWSVRTRYLRGETLEVWSEYTGAGGAGPGSACGDPNGDGVDEVAAAERWVGMVGILGYLDTRVATLTLPEDAAISLAFTAPDAQGYASLVLGDATSGAVWVLDGGPGF